MGLIKTKYKYDKKLCIVNFDLTKYSVDDITKISEIKQQLSSLQAKLEIYENVNALVHEHDRKIAILESRSEKNYRGQNHAIQ